MKFGQRLKQLIPIALVFLLCLTACSSAPSKYDAVQQETTGTAAVDKEAIAGGTFNQFFPESEGGYSVVPAQEKQGFAEYKLKQNGDTLAMLTINDTASLPAAAIKYKNTPDTLAGYPSVQQGDTTTAILVNGRYQVKVLSRDDAFTPADRATWIEKFNLQGLAQLESKLTTNQQAKRVLPKITPKVSPLPEPETAPLLVPQPAT